MTAGCGTLAAGETPKSESIGTLGGVGGKGVGA